MKDITITINESDITERIATVSGYAALARSKAGMPERFTDIMQTTDDDRVMATAILVWVCYTTLSRALSTATTATGRNTA